MLAGHFGVAAAVKARRPELLLGVLLVASQLPDLAFLPLSAVGVEALEPVAGARGYGSLWIDALYSHALVSNVLLAALAGALVHLLVKGRWSPGAG
ncbi:hypothetical protein [Nocardiopsis ansamitocini]|uniref:Uncharacterized protein n=1 Tax=Nocardiopsis ansamitocini TaxID=1670832 RepID=A0A9W6UJ56_9ACTN|nr:hypothetical protein [Nocardiopsis ansamitocini]GLU48153.1 hypothetical protein Nans01_25040 [Nocardiopsis ansamitocini]